MNNTELNLEIGQRLREARKAQSLSLAQLSERTGGTLSKSRISNYEQGIRRMGIEQALILAEALGTISAIHLLCLDDNKPQLSQQEQRLIGHFRATDDTGRLRILETAETVKKT
jgi:transcriptional regulator with XRE-family HTH domain